MPNETRVTPASRRAASAAGSTSSGLASVVTSAPGARPKAASIAATMRPTWAPSSSVGVPPPKNTVLAGRARSPSTRRARAISSIAARV